MTIDDRKLDVLLREWASTPAGDDADHARIINRAGGIIDRTPSYRRWLVGGMGIAASIALALLVPRPVPANDPAIATPDAAFAALYTPTPVEEQLL